MKHYPIPAGDVQTEYEVRKSRFIARLAHAQDRTQAMALLDAAKNDFPDARHHCWAYLFGAPVAASAGMSDDGEPSGTAGKPILNVLQHKGIGDIMIIVIRYFGGVKLGAGGLVRAYSAAAQQAIDLAETIELAPSVAVTISADFSVEQVIRHWLQQNGGRVDQIDYTATNIELMITFPEKAANEWRAFAAAHKVRQLDRHERRD